MNCRSHSNITKSDCRNKSSCEGTVVLETKSRNDKNPGQLLAVKCIQGSFNLFYYFKEL